MSKQAPKSSNETASGDYAVGTIVFDKFEILEFIAAGGKGRVFKARDILLDHTVALKVLSGEGANERDFIRFQTEAKTASKLKHNNIATVYDFGLIGSTPYLSMEFVEGCSLDEMLKVDGTLALPLFIDIFTQVCDALVHAHKNGVVHRDLKPANVAIGTNHEDRLSAKILDFGIAKRIDVLVEHDGRLTGTGDIVGTPFYMSPEQARGESVSPQSDVYSLACMMWHCLAGRPPFVAATAIETIMLHQDRTVRKSVSDLPDAIPLALRELLCRMLSKDAAERGDLERDIIPVLQSVAVDGIAGDDEAESDSQTDSQADDTLDTVVDTVPAGKRNNTTAYLIAGVAAVCLLGGLVLLLSITKPAPVEREAVSFHEIMNIPEGVDVDFDKNVDKRRQFAIANETDVGMRFEATDEELLRMKNREKLVTLTLAGSPVTDRALAILADSKKLTKLNLSQTKIETLEHVGKLKELTMLDLKDTKVTDQALRNLSGLIKLRVLALSDCPITDQALVLLPVLPDLHELELEGTDLTGATFDHLKKQKKLATLRIKKTLVTVPNLRNAALQKNITFIDISDCKFIGDKGNALADEFPCTTFQPFGNRLNEETNKAQEALDKKMLSVARNHYERCAGFVEKQYGRSDMREVQYLLAVGRTYRFDDRAKLDDNYEKTIAVWRRAAEIAHENKSFDQEVQANDTIALLTNTLYGFQNAEPLLVANYKRAKEYLPNNLNILDTSAYFLGISYFQNGRFEKGASMLSDSIEYRKKLYGANSAPVATTMVRLGECHRSMKNVNQAKTHLNTALKIFKQHHPSTASQKRALEAGLCALAWIEFDKDPQLALNHNENAMQSARQRSYAPSYQVALEQRLQFYKRLKRPQAEIDEITQLAALNKVEMQQKKEFLEF